MTGPPKVEVVLRGSKWFEEAKFKGLRVRPGRTTYFYTLEAGHTLQLTIKKKET